MDTFISDISKKEFPVENKVSAKSIRIPIINLIKQDYPEFSEESSISTSELKHYRRKYITEAVSKQIGDVSELEKKVLSSLSNETTITDKIDDGEDDNILSFGQKIADKVATFGGSWTFIISFGIFILIWVIINVIWLSNKAFDPYPFILLNLMLSCLAALQAPVIMMSQNRQEDKDRERSKKDYMVNLKSELEVRGLHEKIDHLILHQQQHLIEAQNIQIELLNEIVDHLEKENAINS